MTPKLADTGRIATSSSNDQLQGSPRGRRGGRGMPRAGRVQTETLPTRRSTRFKNDADSTPALTPTPASRRTGEKKTVNSRSDDDEVEEGEEEMLSDAEADHGVEQADIQDEGFADAEEGSGSGPENRAVKSVRVPSHASGTRHPAPGPTSQLQRSAPEQLPRLASAREPDARPDAQPQQGLPAPRWGGEGFLARLIQARIAMRDGINKYCGIPAAEDGKADVKRTPKRKGGGREEAEEDEDEEDGHQAKKPRGGQ
jgi:hypothetical protein